MTKDKQICDRCKCEIPENRYLRNYFGSKICGRCYRSQCLKYSCNK